MMLSSSDLRDDDFVDDAEIKPAKQAPSAKATKPVRSAKSNAKKRLKENDDEDSDFIDESTNASTNEKSLKPVNPAKAVKKVVKKAPKRQKLNDDGPNKFAEAGAEVLSENKSSSDIKPMKVKLSEAARVAVNAKVAGDGKTGGQGDEDGNEDFKENGIPKLKKPMPVDKKAKAAVKKEKLPAKKMKDVGSCDNDKDGHKEVDTPIPHPVTPIDPSARKAEVSLKAKPAAKKRSLNKDIGTEDKNGIGAAKDNPVKNLKSTPQSGKAKGGSSALVSSSAGFSSNPSSSASLAKAVSGDITKGPDVSNEEDAKTLIMAYFRQQNRPYSAIQIHDNLHKRVQKSSVEKCLAALATMPGKLVCKEYGKSKIYFPDQASMNSNATPADIQQLEESIKGLSEAQSSQKNECAAIRAELYRLQSEPKDSDLDSLYEELLGRAEEKIARLKKIEEKTSKETTNCASAKLDLPSLIQAHNSSRAAWKDRKDMCQDALGTLSELMNKDTKRLAKEMGIETDEEDGVDLPALIAART